MCRGLRINPNAKMPNTDLITSDNEIAKKSLSELRKNRGAMISLQKHFTPSIYARKYQYGSGIPGGGMNNIKNFNWKVKYL